MGGIDCTIEPRRRSCGWEFADQIQGGIWKGVRFSVFGVGPMAMADVDADGDLGLFVGGIANHSDSFSVSSYLMLNVNGQFEESSSSGVFMVLQRVLFFRWTTISIRICCYLGVGVLIAVHK